MHLVIERPYNFKTHIWGVDYLIFDLLWKIVSPRLVVFGLKRPIWGLNRTTPDPIEGSLTSLLTPNEMEELDLGHTALSERLWIPPSRDCGAREQDQYGVSNSPRSTAYTKWYRQSDLCVDFRLNSGRNAISASLIFARMNTVISHCATALEVRSKRQLSISHVTKPRIKRTIFLD